MSRWIGTTHRTMYRINGIRLRQRKTRCDKMMVRITSGECWRPTSTTTVLRAQHRNYSRRFTVITVSRHYYFQPVSESNFYFGTGLRSILESALLLTDEDSIELLCLFFRIIFIPIASSTSCFVSTSRFPLISAYVRICKPANIISIQSKSITTKWISYVWNCFRSKLSNKPEPSQKTCQIYF